MPSLDHGEQYLSAMEFLNFRVVGLLGQHLYPELAAPGRVPFEAGQLAVLVQFRVGTD